MQLIHFYIWFFGHIIKKNLSPFIKFNFQIFTVTFKFVAKNINIPF